MYIPVLCRTREPDRIHGALLNAQRAAAALVRIDKRHAPVLPDLIRAEAAVGRFYRIFLYLVG